MEWKNSPTVETLIVCSLQADLGFTHVTQPLSTLIPFQAWGPGPLGSVSGAVDAQAWVDSGLQQWGCSHILFRNGSHCTCATQLKGMWS